MKVILRSGTPADAEECGHIMHEAFTAIANQHNFPPDFPTPEVGINLASMLLSHPGFYSVVAESGSRVVGSNFLDERCPVAGLGPITVSPAVQDSGVGRQLMQHMLDRVEKHRYPGVRLLQAAYHNRSLALYAKLGFDVREICSTMQGPQVHAKIPGCSVRQAKKSDLDECNRLCTRVHGFQRGGDLLDGIKQSTALVVERNGRVTGYSTMVAFFGHSVGETNEDLQALIAGTPQYQGPGFIVPARNTELLRWCLDNGLRIVQNLTLMTKGLYNEPRGAYLPSVLM